MVIEAALGTGRRVAARPDATVNRIHRLALGERLGGEQCPQPRLIDAPMDECSVEAAPAAPVRGLAAQVDG